MLRLISDEDVNDAIIKGLRRREPTVDIVRAVDVGLGHTDDPIILEWAAKEGRVLITGDVNTMLGFGWARVQDGLPMSGVVALLENAAIGRAIDDILTVVHCLMADEMKDQVMYIPL
jgi:hypothetical protein